MPTTHEFEVKIVSDDEVVRVTRAGNGKPQLADAFAKIIAEHDIAAVIARGEKSQWFTVPAGVSDLKLRSAAQYHGFSINYAKAKSGGNVFRFNKKFVPVAERPKVAKKAATRKAA